MNKLKRQRKRKLNKKLEVLNKDPNISPEEHNDALQVAKSLVRPVRPL